MDQYGAMKLPRQPILAFLAIISTLCALCPAVHAQSVPLTLKPEASVQFSMAQGEDVFTALYILAENAPALIDGEVIRRHNQAVTRVVPFFSIPKKTYTISELLTLFQTALPEMTWSRDEKEYHVKVVLDKTVDNSLDYLVPGDLTATKTGTEWVDWMNQGIPRSGMVCEQTGLSMGSGPVGPETSQVALTLRRGMTYREVLDKISKAVDVGWKADVEDEETYSRNDDTDIQNIHVPHGYVHLRGSDENATGTLKQPEKPTPPLQPDHVFGTREGDYRWRTGIVFIFWKFTSPGTNIAPVALNGAK